MFRLIFEKLMSSPLSTIAITLQPRCGTQFVKSHRDI
jgi:hypothetical protein